MFSTLYVVFLAILHYSGMFGWLVPSCNELILYLMIGIAIQFALLKVVLAELTLIIRFRQEPERSLL